ncbi:MAG: hypothetical protein U9R08_04680 [Nanoarchaeota archaeon]|nr:hypothetical protein [Nanoarchaeota archaeon]
MKKMTKPKTNILTVIALSGLVGLVSGCTAHKSAKVKPNLGHKPAIYKIVGESRNDEGQALYSAKSNTGNIRYIVSKRDIYNTGNYVSLD